MNYADKQGWITRNLRSKRLRLRIVFHRRYKFIVLVGSVLISGSLALKEHIDARSREFSARVDSQDNFFRLQQLADETSERIVNVEEVLSSLTSQRKIDSIEAVEQDAADLNSRSSDISLILDNEEKLLIILPDAETEIRHEFVEYREWLGRIAEQTDHWDRSMLEPTKRKEWKSKLTDEQANLKNDVLSASYYISRLLEERRANYQRLSTLMTFTCYTIVALGFALSVTGKFAGKVGDVD